MSDVASEYLPGEGEWGASLRKERRRKPVNTEALKVDRLPPHSIEAEQGVLGCILLSPEECMATCVERIKVGAAVFYDVRHQEIYEVFRKMDEERVAMDMITVSQRLKDQNELEQVGGAAYLSGLVEKVPSAANLEFYIGIVLEKAMLRGVIHMFTDAVANIHEAEGEAAERVLDDVQREFLDYAERWDDADRESTMQEMLLGVVDDLERYSRGGAQLHGLSYGFQYLDKMTGGMQGTQMITVGARPGCGKTSIALNVTEEVCGAGHGVGIFSLEMTRRALMLRMSCSVGRADLQRFRTGYATQEDFRKIIMAHGKMKKWKLVVNDSSSLTVMQIRSKARRWKRQYDIKLVVIDYLQLVRPSGRHASREQDVAEISAGLKGLAKELDIPVIVLAQLNRETEKNRGRKPQLSDLRESGSVEQDSDVVMFLYQPELADYELEAFKEKSAYKEDGERDWSAFEQRVNLLVAKQREGPTGDVEMVFWKNCTRFTEYQRPANERKGLEKKKAVRRQEQQDDFSDVVEDLGHG